jgi:spore coat protein CotH
VTALADHKNIERICIIIGIITLIIGIVFSYFGESVGITAGSSVDLSYETELFDDSEVHTIDVVISETDWNNLQENATDEVDQICDVTIDGETLSNVAIRPKGNSSLSSVAASDSERYSFKIDFDKYNDSLSYHGLDKLNLNNIISDNTYLKDYLCFDMMEYMGVDAPLTSFVKVSINGEYFGLYLAVEGVEEAFAQRNYGSDDSNIYKPDSMQVGGGEMGGGERPDMTNMPEMPQGTDGDREMVDMSQMPDMTEMPDMTQMGNMGGFSGDDVALIYSDDDLSSYENIWAGAVFDVTTSDKKRLIEAIKQLNASENLEAVVDVEAVLKYFVVHNFVDNFDSYTGSMKHNYYLREVEGQLSVIPWDYNLAFSNFMGGMGGGNMTATAVSTDEATALVNYPIDTPVSGTTMEERPLLNQLLSNEEYLAQYHQYFAEFISGYFDSGQCSETIDAAVALISEYVKEDPTAFCTYQEYQEGVSVLEQFCDLRAQSISGQLEGSIPATTDGQTAQPATLIDASSLDVSAMGSSMGGGMARGISVPTDLSVESTASADVTSQTPTETNWQSAKGQPPNQSDGDVEMEKPANQPGADTESTTVAGDQTGAGQTTPANADGQQNNRFNPNGATTTNDNLWTLILLGGSCLLLVLGILATKLYKR